MRIYIVYVDAAPIYWDNGDYRAEEALVVGVYVSEAEARAAYKKLKRPYGIECWEGSTRVWREANPEAEGDGHPMPMGYNRG